MFNVYQKSSKEGFVVAIAIWYSSQLPEQKEGLFVSYTVRPNDRALVLLLCINIRDFAGSQLI